MNSLSEATVIRGPAKAPTDKTVTAGDDADDGLAAERDAVIADAHGQLAHQPLHDWPRRFGNAAGDVGVLQLRATITVVLSQISARSAARVRIQ